MAILSIQKPVGSKPAQCTPNILPCRVNYSNTVNANERYWTPTAAENGKQTAYFRGRKLEGEVVKLPEGYRGVVLKNTDRVLPASRTQQAIVPEELDLGVERESLEEVKVAEEIGSFDEFVVWGHDRAPEVMEDPYTKGVQEFMRFAEAMNSYEQNGEKKA